MMKMKNRARTARCTPVAGVRGQQEMVGFALIVVVVVVGLMIFLIMSINNTPESGNSLEVDRMLSSIMRQTTDCAISFEPRFDNFEDLFKSCYDNDRCSNLGKDACDYLNESLRAVVTDLLKSDASASAYQLDFLQRDDGGEQGILRIFEGNCTGSVSSAQRNLVSGSEKLVIRMKICS